MKDKQTFVNSIAEEKIIIAKPSVDLILILRKQNK